MTDNGAYELGMRHVLKRLQEAERIDARHGFRLPGDSALYIAMWALECDLDGKADATTGETGE